MKAVIVAWGVALFQGLFAIVATVLVALNINELPYVGAMFALALVVIVWCPFIVCCYKAKDEWDYYCWRELMKQKRRRRYGN